MSSIHDRRPDADSKDNNNDDSPSVAPVPDRSTEPKEGLDIDDNGNQQHGQIQDQAESQPQAVLVDPEMSRVTSGPAYSVFSKGTRRWILAMVTAASFVSPMTANIYFPALNPIAEDLGVSLSLINITLTSYMVFQGLSPTIFGDMGDMMGRRPAYILAFAIYIAANVGLAVQRSYPALLVLRCLQSAGSSGSLVLGFAVIADISSTAERGKYMGIVGAGINVGPGIGPVLGGIMSQYFKWPAIFWFCTIVAAAWLIPWVLTGPETCRRVVGNGSIPPQSWNRPLIDVFKRRKTVQQELPLKRKLRFPNPLKTLSVAWDKEMAIILFLSALVYLAFILTAATLGTLFKEIYHFNDLQIGLCYLPYGLGCALAVIAQGYVLDWNYRRIARTIGFTIDLKRGDNLSTFPIEKARIQPCYPMLTVGAIALVGYGWALEVETTVAVPLVLVFIIGMLIPTSFSVLGTLVVDLNPEAPATATAANNLVRCLQGAAMTAAIDYMIAAMGRGWCFTFLALLIVASIPILWIVDQRGLQWRAAKAKKKELARVDAQGD